MMEIKLRDYLREYPALTVHVPETNIFGQDAIGVDDNYITIHLISKPRGQFGTRMSRIQINIFQKSYGQGKVIAGIIEQAVNEFPEGFATFNDNQVDFFNPETNLHQIVLDGAFYELEKVIFTE